jgi:hypothetical protein
MTLRNTVYTWRAALTDSDLSAITRHVALTLSIYMSEKGDSAFPGARRLAHDTGLSERAVRKQLTALVDAGWLVIVERGGLRGESRRANAYRAAIPNPGPVDTHVQRASLHTGTTTPVPTDHDPGPVDTPTIHRTIQEQGAPRKRGSRIPLPFEVTEHMQAWCAEKCPGLDWDYETSQFVDYWRATTGTRATKQDWPACWRTWMRRAHKERR